MAKLELQSLSKSYGKNQVFSDINVTISHGEFIVVIAPNGAGKSTLLRIIAGLEMQDKGSVFIDGENVDQLSPAKRGIGMVFQNNALYPNLSARGNIELGLKRLKVPRDEIYRRVKNVVHLLSIEGFLGRKPSDLSGGQLQRVALARAIVRQPRFFLFDEPLTNLDQELRSQVRYSLMTLHHQLGTTMIYVTNDQVEAMSMADRIMVLADGQLQQIGSPQELFNNPNNKSVARYIGAPMMNFIPINDVENIFQVCEIADCCADVGVRPNHLVIEEEGEVGWLGTIRNYEYFGELSNSYINIGHGCTLVVEHSSKQIYSPGQRVIVRPTKTPLLFDRSGARLDK